jgi:hypothetical protein
VFRFGDGIIDNVGMKNRERNSSSSCYRRYSACMKKEGEEVGCMVLNRNSLSRAAVKGEPPSSHFSGRSGGRVNWQAETTLSS